MNLQDAVAEWWQTPRVGAHGQPGKHNGKADSLGEQVKMWATPTTRDYKSADIPNRQGTPALSEQVMHFRQDQAISTDGHECSRKCRRLNPLFVDYLMGLPTGWTGLGLVGTASFRLWLRSHSLRLAGDLGFSEASREIAA